MMNWTSRLAADPLLVAIEEALPALAETLATANSWQDLSDEAVALLRSTGVFRMTIPAELGGLQADPLVQLRAVERLSEVDACLGWYANIGSDGGYYSAFLSREAAKDLYGSDPDVITAGFVDPAGVAVPVPGGYRVSGTWPFGSASRHCAWLASGCRVESPGANGAPPGQAIVAMLPQQACHVDEDSWHALGLHRSGSFSYAADDVFVAAEYTFSFTARPLHPDPMYQCPVMYRSNAPGVPLGIARGALADFAALAGATTAGAGRRPMRDSAQVQHALGHATAAVESARAHAYQTVSDLWQSLLAGDEVTAEQRVSFRLMLAHSAQMCREAVLELFRACGGAAVHDHHPLQRRLRDMLAAAQHTLAHDRGYPLCGSVLAGSPMADPML